MDAAGAPLRDVAGVAAQKRAGKVDKDSLLEVRSTVEPFQGDLGQTVSNSPFETNTRRAAILSGLVPVVADDIREILDEVGVEADDSACNSSLGSLKTKI